MQEIPDLTDPRYLDEVGWFLSHEQYGRQQFGGSYEAERVAYSRLLRDEVLSYCGHDTSWLRDKTVVSLGCGCTGDLSAWDAAVKIAVDPLLATYQRLQLLVDDVAGTSRTVYLSVGAEALPLLEACADLVICRNALDHMPEPHRAVGQMARILKPEALLFLSVDVGGVPTPDEPTVFSVENLTGLLQEHFVIVQHTDGHQAHSGWRAGSLRLVARNKPSAQQALDKAQILHAYRARLGLQE